MRRDVISSVGAMVLAILSLLALAVPSTASASGDRGTSLESWLRSHADPIDARDMHKPDVRALRRVARGAQVVGLGEAVHGAHEIAVLKLATLKVLVRHADVRTVAWEDDWTTGRALDRALRGKGGALRPLIGRMTDQWHTQETLHTLRWLRRYNARHAADPVRFLGVEYYYTGRSAYNAVTSYVRRVAPERLPRLLHDLDPLRPSASKKKHASWYAAVANKRPYVNRARRVFQGVKETVGPHERRAHSLAVHNARQILWFYEHYDRSLVDQARFREPRTARNLRWWQRRTHDRIAYWAATAHTANGPHLRMEMPGFEFRFASTGSFLRKWYGPRYVSISYTLGGGAVGSKPADVTQLGPAKADWFEAPLADVAQTPSFLIDLPTAGKVPAAVRAWLNAPLITRGIPQAGPDSVIAGDTLRTWYDALVHTERVHPQRGLVVH